MRRILLVIRRVIPFVIAIGGLALILVWMAGGFHEKIEPGSVESPLRQHAGEPLGTVELVNEEINEVAVGTVEALQRTEVAPRITARIDSINVRAGGMVAQANFASLEIAGGAAGAHAVAGIAVGDTIWSVIYAVGAAVDVTDCQDLTDEFTVTGAGQVDNTGGTNTAGGRLLFCWLAA